MQKGEPMAPLFVLLCRLKKFAVKRSCFGRRAPQKRCDQLLFRSKSGGVMFPSGAFRAHGDVVLLKKNQCKRRDGKNHSFVSGFHAIRDFI
jgi:hypothetical protein